MSNIWKHLTSLLSNLTNFHSLEVVDRVSETQLQVGENSGWIIWRLKGWPAGIAMQANYAHVACPLVMECHRVHSQDMDPQGEAINLGPELAYERANA